MVPAGHARGFPARGVSGPESKGLFAPASRPPQAARGAHRRGYQVGVRIHIDVLNAQSQLYQTQRDLARARYDVLVGLLRLKQAAGALTVADLGPVNQMLAP